MYFIFFYYIEKISIFIILNKCLSFNLLILKNLNYLYHEFKIINLWDTM